MAQTVAANGAENAVAERDRDADRRTAQRVDAKLEMQLHLPREGSIERLETINVSSAGVYFRSPSFIEPMTRLEMSFDVPLSSGENRPIRCEGVVARTVPESATDSVEDFEVAVFFTSIDRESRKNLAHYIEDGIVGT